MTARMNLARAMRASALKKSIAGANAVSLGDFFTGYHSLIACARYAWKHETVCLTFCRRDTAPQTARKAFAGRRRLRASASGLLLRPALRAKRACTRRVAGRSRVFLARWNAVCRLPLCCAMAFLQEFGGHFLILGKLCSGIQLLKISVCYNVLSVIK